MVMRTDYFTWQVGTVIHEWTHNFLSLRPLGINYGTTPELRTMNETTASIVENEIGPLLLARYYPTMAASFPDLRPGRVEPKHFPTRRPSPLRLPRRDARNARPRGRIARRGKN